MVTSVYNTTEYRTVTHPPADNDAVTSRYARQNMHIRKGELHSLTCGICNSLHFCELFGSMDMDTYSRM